MEPITLILVAAALVVLALMVLGRVDLLVGVVCLAIIVILFVLLPELAVRDVRSDP